MGSFSKLSVNSGSPKRDSSALGIATSCQSLTTVSEGEGGSPKGHKQSTPKRGSKVVMKLAQLDQNMREEALGQKKVDWIKTPKADTFFGLVILLNAAFIGIDVEFGGDFSWGFWAVESVFLFIFCVELSMRLWSDRRNLRLFFDMWGIFDTSITLMGCIDAWLVTPILGTGNENPLSSFTVLRMFRLVRLVRLIRVLRMFGELAVMVQTLGNSIRAVFWMSVLLGMIMYTGSIITVLMLGQPYSDDPKVQEHFGSLGASLFSHFCIVTLEGWPDIALTAMHHNGLWALYFIAQIILMNFALVNLMVGVIVERIIHLSLEQEKELDSFVAESDQFRSTLRTLFESAKIDHSSEVTKEEVRELLALETTKTIFSAFNINLEIPYDTLHTIMGLQDDGPTNFDDFFRACIRLCGSKHGIHSVFVQHDICDAHQELSSKLKGVEQQVQLLRGGKNRASLRPETALAELLDRMDRFGQVQSQMLSEFHALKEHAGANPRSGVSGSPPRFLGVDCGGGPQLLTKAGQDLGGCCIDSLFSHRRGPTDAPTVDATKARRDLEAEFRNRHGDRG